MTIEKRYRKNINAKNPRNYFENWYANMWRNIIRSEHVSRSLFFKIFTDELSKVGAEVTPTDDAYYNITFKNERDYLMFLLRWS